MQLYGLVGYPLGHSFSKKYFTDKFEREGLRDVVYENFETTDLAELKIKLGKEPCLMGLNVTIPYKSGIISYLDSYDDTVAKLRACNCIKIENDKWIGFNTDVVGFENSFVRKRQPHQKYALILGTGGSSKAVEFVLQKLGISYLLVSRKKITNTIIPYKQVDRYILEKYKIIINTTPLGMYPNVDEYPPINYDLITDDHYLFDLIYNPEKTVFLKKGEARGARIENGYEMLVGQAEESWRIWNER